MTDHNVEVRQLDGRPSVFMVTFSPSRMADLSDDEKARQMISAIAYSAYHKIRDLQKDAGLEPSTIETLRARPKADIESIKS